MLFYACLEIGMAECDSRSLFVEAGGDVAFEFSSGLETFLVSDIRLSVEHNRYTQFCGYDILVSSSSRAPRVGQAHVEASAGREYRRSAGSDQLYNREVLRYRQSNGTE